MAKDANSGGSLRELLEGKALSAAEERKLLAGADPAQHPALLELYSERLRKTRSENVQLVEALAQMQAPPLHPATVLRRAGAGDGRVEVSVGGRRQLVPVASEVALGDLWPGREVLLSNNLGVVVATTSAPCAGSIATVCEIADGALVVRASGDEETVVGCDPDLLNKLETGDRVVLASGVPIAVRRLARRMRSEFELRDPDGYTVLRVVELAAYLKTIVPMLEPPEAIGVYALAELPGRLATSPRLQYRLLGMPHQLLFGRDLLADFRPTAPPAARAICARSPKRASARARAFSACSRKLASSIRRCFRGSPRRSVANR